MNDINIKESRELAGITQDFLASELGVTVRTISSWENGATIPKGKQEMIRKYFSLKTKEPEVSSERDIHVVDSYELQFTKNKNANHFTRLPNGQYYMTMPLAEHKIQAGFLDNYQDIELLKGMSQHGIIVDRPAKGRYLAFRVKGDSMDDGTSDAIPQNYIVATRELQRQHWTSLIRFKDFRFWVIYTTESKFPLLKEITGHDVEKGIISCHSLNDSPEYKDFDLSLNDVQALFYVINIQRDVAKDYY
ncbi:helix-turn-helix transcriptional regulator [Flavobacterium sp. DGU11]|uniref:Helix-turn-helix transcriptional regulator n=1 Tax=Flavobacterium arundinis TaxID=3139143 RepID=A0ABU9HTR6_9FLAO